MRNINRVIVAGNMTRDPEVRMLPSDALVANFSLALNRRYRDKNGESQEETTFIDCEAFGRTAEFLREYGRKGRALFVEGRLRQDRWQDKEGNPRSAVRIVVDNAQFTDAPMRDGEAASGGSVAGETPRGNHPSRLSRSELEELLPF